MKKNYFKPLLSGICLAVIMVAGSASAIPTPYEIPGFGQDMAKNGTGISGGNGNDDANNFFRLQTVLASYVNNLPTPVLAGALDLGSNVVPTGGLLGYDYAVLHYGTGRNGITGVGGGVEFFYLNGAADFTFPADGTGLNGIGGFSSLTLIKGTPQVPDGGSTIALLGFALTGVGLLRRKILKA